MAKSFFNFREQTVTEAKSKASDELRAYAKKSGGIDKKDFMVLAGKLDNFAGSGNPGVVADVAKMLRDMDTDPRDKAIEIMMKNDPAMTRSVMRKAGLKEEVELQEEDYISKMEYHEKQAQKTKGAEQRKHMEKAKEYRRKAEFAQRGGSARSYKESVELDEAIRDRKSYEAGQKAAQLGKKYDTNPYPKGSQSHLDWSKGHNSARSAKIDRRNEGLEENANVDYKPSSEKSQFGGYRAKLVNPQGKASYLGSTAYKTSKAAEGEAAAYRDGYFGGPGKANERGASRMVDAYKKKNTKDLYKKESVEIDEALEVKLRGGKVPVGQHRFKYDVDKSDKYIENSIKARDKDAKVERKGKDLWVTASAQAHSSVIASLRQFRIDGTISEGNMGRDEKSRAKNDANRLANNKIVAKHKFANQKPKKEEAELDEAMKYTDKQIKMAYGIINDPRYKSGNMTAIVKKIEQIARGLSKHPGVVKALRVTNEDFESDDSIIEALINQEIEAMDMIEESLALDENWDEYRMALGQLRFIQYAAEEIAEWMEEDMDDMPEWYQNKLTMAFAQMQSLHSYAEGDRYDDDEDDDEEEMDEYYREEVSGVQTACTKLSTLSNRRSKDAEDLANKLSPVELKDVSRNPQEFLKLCKHPLKKEILKNVKDIQG
jgi:hypothetical protein